MSVHPGLLLRHRLDEEGINISQAAKRLGVHRVSLSNLCNGSSAFSIKMALRCERCGWGMATTWAMKQMMYDLARAREEQ